MRSFSAVTSSWWRNQEVWEEMKICEDHVTKLGNTSEKSPPPFFFIRVQIWNIFNTVDRIISWLL